MLSLPVPQPKQRPALLSKREKQAAVTTTDTAERKRCHVRSQMRCEVWRVKCQSLCKVHNIFVRCVRHVSENHHLIGGSGRRNKGKSILAEHRLDCCSICHEEITHGVLVPVDGTLRELAATVQYERWDQRER